MIPVTKPYLPERDRFHRYVDEIYDRNWLTNNGPLVSELTNRLESYLGVRNLLLVSNGTIALQLAYKLLNLKGEVITTPFTFAATSSSIIWEGLCPVYADVSPESYNLCIENIESLINETTSAIVPVHVYGNACDVEGLARIAHKYNLKIIYDAAHAFDVSKDGNNLLNYGDVSTISFHATKLFHTIEGGALIIKDDELYEKAKSMINFGLSSTGLLGKVGTNAKMSEVNAAMGLCNLEEINKIKASRKNLVALYKKNLGDLVKYQKNDTGFSENYSYMPILFKNYQQRHQVEHLLLKEGIATRRYFYPSLEEVYASDQKMTVSRELADRILCLPLYSQLREEDVVRIVAVIKIAIGEHS